MTNKVFSKLLFSKVRQNIFNDHKSNWDKYRFGDEPKLTALSSFRERIKNGLKFIKYGLNALGVIYIPVKDGKGDSLDYFNFLYQLLEHDEDKDLLITILAYRILGHRKIKLPTNTNEFKKIESLFGYLVDDSDFIKVKFNHFKLSKVNLNHIGIPLEFYFLINGVYIDFVLEQYKYKHSRKVVSANAGDYVIDAGGCWGDTALYFANLVGEQGRVFSYEFIPSNLEIFRKNLALNPNMEKITTILGHPVWETSDLDLKYVDKGPASQVFFGDGNYFDGVTKTLSIDDLRQRMDLPRVNLVKMDIEGAELSALKGAVATIRMFKPKLAIAIYHSTKDFYEIPKFIHEMNLGYKFYLGHYTIHSEETILFASADD